MRFRRPLAALASLTLAALGVVATAAPAHAASISVQSTLGGTVTSVPLNTMISGGASSAPFSAVKIWVTDTAGANTWSFGPVGSGCTSTLAALSSCGVTSATTSDSAVTQISSARDSSSGILYVVFGTSGSQSSSQTAVTGTSTAITLSGTFISAASAGNYRVNVEYGSYSGGVFTSTGDSGSTSLSVVSSGPSSGPAVTTTPVSLGVGCQVDIDIVPSGFSQSGGFWGLASDAPSNYYPAGLTLTQSGRLQGAITTAVRYGGSTGFKQMAVFYFPSSATSQHSSNSIAIHELRLTNSSTCAATPAAAAAATPALAETGRDYSERMLPLASLLVAVGGALLLMRRRATA